MPPPSGWENPARPKIHLGLFAGSRARESRVNAAQAVDFVLFLVRAPNALGRSGDDLSQNVFIANNLEVITDIGGGRNKRIKACNKSRATDGLEQIPIAENLGEGDQINRLSHVP